MRAVNFATLLVASIIARMYALPSPPSNILKRKPGLAGREIIPSMNIIGFTENNAMAAAAAAAPQWRVTYSVYWVHDGALSEGHRHDWESATVAWTSSDGGTNWDRNALYLSKHSGYSVYGWGDIISVDDPTDRSEDHGAYKSHPKVYVGFYKHPMFRDKETDIKVELLTPEDMANKEFRSDDWYYLPHDGDLHPGSEIGDWNTPGGIWDYGHANSDPWNIMQDNPPDHLQNVCHFGET